VQVSSCCIQSAEHVKLLLPLLLLLLRVLQQPELDPISQAAAKAELERGIDKTTNFPVDGAQQQAAHAAAASS
jgi:hypothetical protein